MLSINNSYASFEFSFTTSTGDKIKIEMFDSLEVKEKREKNFFEFSLRHKYGYEFLYERNGLDENDIKEIKKL